MIRRPNCFSSVSHFAQRIHEAIRISDHISSLPLSGTERRQICATKVLPKVLFASEISAPSLADLGKLRSAIARAIWRKRASRSTEVILSLLHPIHIELIQLQHGHTLVLISFAECPFEDQICFPPFVSFGKCNLQKVHLDLFLPSEKR